MKIFISYASTDIAIAKEIATSLISEGHNVFQDHAQLAAGQEYNNKIRQEVGESDLFIFLISPDSITPGRYTLTELEFAKKRWRKPSGRVLPVVVKKTDISSIPTYLRSVTLLEPKGNVVAEVLAAIYQMRRFTFPKMVVSIGVPFIAMVSIAALFWNISQPSFNTSEFKGDFSIVSDEGNQIFIDFLEKNKGNTVYIESNINVSTVGNGILDCQSYLDEEKSMNWIIPLKGSCESGYRMAIKNIPEGLPFDKLSMGVFYKHLRGFFDIESTYHSLVDTYTLTKVDPP